VAYGFICGLGAVALGVFFFLSPFSILIQAALGIAIGLNLYFMLVVWSFHKSPEAGYNRLQSTTDLYDTENCNIKRMPLENPIHLTAYLMSGIVSGAVQSILNALLLIGVFQKKRIFVTVWLVAHVVICGLGLLLFVNSFFQYATDRTLQVGLGISIGLHLYFLLVVWSFHKSPEAGYNTQRNAAYVDDNENYNIKRMSLENPI